MALFHYTIFGFKNKHIFPIHSLKVSKAQNIYFLPTAFDVQSDEEMKHFRTFCFLAFWSFQQQPGGAK